MGPGVIPSLAAAAGAALGVIGDLIEILLLLLLVAFLGGVLFAIWSSFPRRHTMRRTPEPGDDLDPAFSNGIPDEVRDAIAERETPGSLAGALQHVDDSEADYA